MQEAGEAGKRALAVNAPEVLLLGRPDERGRLRVAGRTVPLTLPARRPLGAVLQKLGVTSRKDAAAAARSRMRA